MSHMTSRITFLSNDECVALNFNISRITICDVSLFVIIIIIYYVAGILELRWRTFKICNNDVIVTKILCVCFMNTNNLPIGIQTCRSYKSISSQVVIYWYILTALNQAIVINNIPTSSTNSSGWRSYCLRVLLANTIKNNFAMLYPSKHKYKQHVKRFNLT